MTTRPIRQRLHPGLLEQWLRFYGPRRLTEIAETLGIPLTNLMRLIDTLIESGTLISGHLVEGGGPEDICDRENFEILLRIARKSAKPAFTAVDIRFLPLFIAYHQGVARDPAEETDPALRLNQLLGWPAPAGLWETDILPARLEHYRPERMDTWLQAMQSEGLRWIGRPGRKVLFCYEDELDLIGRDDLDPEVDHFKPAGRVRRPFAPGQRPLPFFCPAGHQWHEPGYAERTLVG